MEPEEGKISVWVCREEKLVSGLSRKTTCADVVKVLLEDQNLRQGASAAMLSAAPHCYCVVEKWRGFERVLPNKTKILRLWSAWGDEQENVRFVLLKNDASLPNSGPRSAEARVVQSRDGCGPPAAAGGAGAGTGTGGLRGTARGCWSAAAAAANLSQEKQRRIVRKAFRKLDKMNKKKEEALSREQSCVEKMETLVHLVLSQDHTLRQQLQRLRQLDAEIERCEAKVHLERIKRHGANYVQDTYLAAAATAAGAGTDEATATATTDDAAAAEARVTAEALAQLEEYARRCEEVLRVHEELTEREALLERVTADIQEELNRRWMRRRRDHHAERAGPDDQQADAAAAAATASVEAADADADVDVDSLSEDELALEEERIRTQLDTSLYIGLRLQTDAEAARTELERSAAVWESREQELRQLLAQVDAVELQGGEAEGAPGSARSQAQAQAQAQARAQGSEEAWAEQVRGLSKTCSANDDDSDTGLSSMHSQDSDNPPVCESLV